MKDQWEEELVGRQTPDCRRLILFLQEGETYFGLEEVGSGGQVGYFFYGVPASGEYWVLAFPEGV